MPAVTRKGDMCTGHGDFPPRPSTSGSSKVFIDGIQAHCVGDSWDTHCNSSPSCHSGSLSGGSSKVFVSGKALGRVGDPVDCGSTVDSGSSKVFAN